VSITKEAEDLAGVHVWQAEHTGTSAQWSRVQRGPGLPRSCPTSPLGDVICVMKRLDGMQTLPLGSFSTLLESAASADATLRSASGGAGGNNPLPPELDWELDGANLELCRREDGTPWQLGQGSFGTVWVCNSCASWH